MSPSKALIELGLCANADALNVVNARKQESKVIGSVPLFHLNRNNPQGMVYVNLP